MTNVARPSRRFAEKWLPAVNYQALATDYDGTLAADGVVDDLTVEALVRLAATSRKLILVTGRELEELEAVFPHLGLFDRVVAENGALLLTPATREIRLLAEPPPASFIEEIKRRRVSPLSVGRVIVATRVPLHIDLRQAIDQAGLDLQIIFNKRAVMVLPAGVDKGTGLCAALDELGLPLAATVGVGDAENDQAFMRLCGCAVAVDNALPALKNSADLVTRGARGAGVVELIEGLIRDDLAASSSRLWPSLWKSHRERPACGFGQNRQETRGQRGSSARQLTFVHLSLGLGNAWRFPAAPNSRGSAVMIAIASENRVCDCVDSFERVDSTNRVDSSIRGDSSNRGERPRSDRTGSLRAIGDILGELLAGYDLPIGHNLAEPFARAESELVSA